MKAGTIAAIEALSQAPSLRHALEVAARIAASQHANDVRRGQSSSANDERAELRCLVDDLGSLRERLSRPLLGVAHAACWPAADYAADLEALRRLHYAAVFALGSVPPARRGSKSALPTLAYRVVKALQAHGLPVATTVDGAPVRLLVMLAAEAGIALSPATCKNALARAVKAIKWADSAAS